MKAKFLLFIVFTLQINAQCWDKISSGAYHTIAIAQNGTLWAWGYNSVGQIGNGTTTNQLSPVQIGTDTNWSKIATGYNHSFAIKTDGTLWAWGNNFDGELGNGNNVNQLSPVQIGTSQWLDVVGGQEFSIGVKSNGTLWTWGSNLYGQLGDGGLPTRNYPFQIGTATDWLQVAAGQYHSYALKTTKKLWAWGRNHVGQLGDNTTVLKINPVAISPSLSFDYITGGPNTGAAIDTAGALYTWGVGITINSHFPYQLTTFTTGFTNVKLGTGHTIATRNVAGTNYFYTWGQNSFGELGNVATTLATPTLNTLVSNPTSKIAVNFYSSQILDTNGQLHSSGQNHVGQLAIGNNTGVNLYVYGFSIRNCPAALSLESFDAQNTISLYPNPVFDQLTISNTNTSEIQKLAIYDITGKKVKFQEGNTTSIAVNDLTSGFYLLEITIDGKTTIKKFVKQ